MFATIGRTPDPERWLRRFLASLGLAALTACSGAAGGVALLAPQLWALFLLLLATLFPALRVLTLEEPVAIVEPPPIEVVMAEPVELADASDAPLGADDLPDWRPPPPPRLDEDHIARMSGILMFLSAAGDSGSSLTDVLAASDLGAADLALDGVAGVAGVGIGELHGGAGLAGGAAGGTVGGIGDLGGPAAAVGPELVRQAPAASDAGIEGTCRVTVVVGTDGVPKYARVSGCPEPLAGAARAAAMASTFRAGQPGDARLTYRFGS
jgi:hypothetical protein